MATVFHTSLVKPESGNRYQLNVWESESHINEFDLYVYRIVKSFVFDKHRLIYRERFRSMDLATNAAKRFIQNFPTDIIFTDK